MTHITLLKQPIKRSSFRFTQNIFKPQSKSKIRRFFQVLSVFFQPRSFSQFILTNNSSNYVPAAFNCLKNIVVKSSRTPLRSESKKPKKVRRINRRSLFDGHNRTYLFTFSQPIRRGGGGAGSPFLSGSFLAQSIELLSRIDRRELQTSELATSSGNHTDHTPLNVINNNDLRRVHGVVVLLLCRGRYFSISLRPACCLLRSPECYLWF